MKPANIIEDIPNKFEATPKKEEDSGKDSIRSVETMLGYSISPSRYEEIHTDGKVEVKASLGKVEETIIQIVDQSGN